MLTRLAHALVVLTAFLALQASVLGGAAACALSGHGDMSGSRETSPSVGSSATAAESVPASDASMDGMAMGGAPDVPCEHGTAPRDCAAMPVCSVFAVSSPSHAHEPGIIAARVASMVALAPTSPTIVPEPPPPRA